MIDDNDFVWPKSDQHISGIGRTGSGKTVFGAWLLSFSDFDQRPHIIIDFKRDPLLNRIPRLQRITYKDIPTEPGLYALHAMQGDQESVDDFLWNIWENENTGVFLDEGYMVDRNSKAFNALLTQGRSKNISVMTMTQRPTYCSRFVFSEASYFAVFQINDSKDRARIEEFTGLDTSERLAPYYSRWYDVSRDKQFIMEPVEDSEVILKRFEERLPEPEKKKGFWR